MTSRTVTSPQARAILLPHKHGETEYFLKGTNPKLLIVSGMHGDEYEVIDCINEYVKQHIDQLPDFLFIPRVSPSAVAQKTRKNKFGRDVNRHFFDQSEDPEAEDAMQIMRNYQVDLTIEFHEDPDRALGFYLYDSHALNEKDLVLYREKIQQTGARLYTGVDDPFDAHLGLHIEKGYIYTPLEILPKDAGFFVVWALTHGIAQRVLNPEIPGKAPLSLKRSLVTAVFSFFLPPDGVMS